MTAPKINFRVFRDGEEHIVSSSGGIVVRFKQGAFVSANISQDSDEYLEACEAMTRHDMHDNGATATYQQSSNPLENVEPKTALNIEEKERPLIKRIDMAIHFMELAGEKGITVKFTNEDASTAYVAYRATRTIKTRPIRNTGFYVSALHEMGHLLGKRQCSAWSTLRSEWEAWVWAKDNAIIWTATADRVMRKALLSYYPSATDAQRANMPAEFTALMREPLNEGTST